MNQGVRDNLNAEARDALATRCPQYRWSPMLRDAFAAAEGPRQHAEGRFLVRAGLLVLVITLLVDAIVLPAHVAELALARLVLVLPLQLAALVLPLRFLGLQKALICASLILFGLILLRASFWAPAPLNAYMAIGPVLLFGVALPVLPLGLRGHMTFAGAAMASIAATVALLGDGLPGADVYLMIAAMTASFAFLIAGRFRALAERNFLLSTISAHQLEALAASNRTLDQLARLDPLTGLANRRTVQTVFAEQFANGVGESGVRAALLMVDLDHFKIFNDRWGHQAGDDCLRAAARLMKHVADTSGGIAARFGGEEFILLLHVDSTARAMAIAERLRTAIERIEIPHAQSGAIATCTTSIGVAIASDSEGPSFEALLARADAALYAAKRDGRNRTLAAA